MSPNSLSWRLFITERLPAAKNMAIDQAILEAVARGEAPPTVRFYSWSPPAVSIGYFQHLDAVVDRAVCELQGIDIVRRLTGGGAVYHDQEITYSVIVPTAHRRIPKRVNDCYKIICDGLLVTLRELGVDAELIPPSDIKVRGKKISGSAMTERQHTLLQHGTLLIGVNVERMFSVLRLPNEAAREQIIQAVRSQVTGLEAEGVTIGFEELSGKLSEGFERTLNVALRRDGLTDAELSRSVALERDRYRAPAWLLKYA